MSEALSVCLSSLVLRLKLCSLRQSLSSPSVCPCQPLEAVAEFTARHAELRERHQHLATKPIDEAKLWVIWDALDADGSGTLDRQELAVVFKQMGTLSGTTSSSPWLSVRPSGICVRILTLLGYQPALPVCCLLTGGPVFCILGKQHRQAEDREAARPGLPNHRHRQVRGGRI
eukprot:SAG22_NODE_298_length_12785_cov_5.760129_19_plen_173_part_00